LLLSGLTVLNKPEFAKLSKAVLSVIVRHSLFANLNPADLESGLFEAAREMRTVGATDSARALKSVIGMLQSLNPSDKTLRERIGDSVLSRQHALYVLEELALAKQSKMKTQVFDSTKLSVEHIYPQDAQKTIWPNSDELRPLLWSLGNLALLEPTLNRNCGAKAYTVKIKEYQKSEIQLTTEIPVMWSAWTKVSIDSRALALLKLAKNIWPERLV
jgi:hypothetical protein